MLKEVGRAWSHSLIWLHERAMLPWRLHPVQQNPDGRLPRSPSSSLSFSLSLFPRQPGVDSYRKSTDLQDPYCKLNVTATQSQHSALCESVYLCSISGMKADLFRKPEGGDTITCDAADSHVVVWKIDSPKSTKEIHWTTLQSALVYYDIWICTLFFSCVK